MFMTPTMYMQNEIDRIMNDTQDENQNTDSENERDYDDENSSSSLTSDISSCGSHTID
jgi:hypothetical protein